MRASGRREWSWSAWTAWRIAAAAGLLAGLAVPRVAQPTVVPGSTYRAQGQAGFGSALGSVGSGPFATCKVTVCFGPTLSVGAPGAAVSSLAAAGKVLLFDDATRSVPRQILESPRPAADGRFGASAAGLASDLYVGAPGEAAGAGIVHRFAVDPFSGGTWSAEFRAPRGTPTAGFGSRLAATPQAGVVVGARAASPGTACGAAFLLAPSPLALFCPEATAGPSFGAAVAATERGMALVGAPFAGGPGADTGAVYVFAGASAPVPGAILHTFRNPNASTRGGGIQDAFGAALAAGPEADPTCGGGTRAIRLLAIGAPLADVDGFESAGLVHLFDDDPASATYRRKLLTLRSPRPEAGATFGAALAFVPTATPDGATRSVLLVGAPFDDAGAVDGGAVYQFDADRTSFTFGSAGTGPLLRQQPTSYGAFGASLAPVGSCGEVAAAGPGRSDDLAARGAVDVLANCGNGISSGEQCETTDSGCSLDCVQGPLECGSTTTARLRALANAAVCDCGSTTGSPCDDTVGCTDDDRCTGSGQACAGLPDDSRCNDLDPCTIDRCDPVADCVNDPIVCPDDGDSCTIETCDPSTGSCRSVRAAGCLCSRDAECDDADPCSGQELCVRRCKGCELSIAGQEACCSGGQRVCSVERPVIPDVTSCDDGDDCTIGDTCGSEGKCRGTRCGLEAATCGLGVFASMEAACSAQRPDRPPLKAIARARLLVDKAQRIPDDLQRRKPLKKAGKRAREAGQTARRKRALAPACRTAVLEVVDALLASIDALLQRGLPVCTSGAANGAGAMPSG